MYKNKDQSNRATVANIPGTRRPPVHFVNEASNVAANASTSSSSSSVPCAADKYTAIVFRNKYRNAAEAVAASMNSGSECTETLTCEVCGGTTPGDPEGREAHVMSLTHQFALPQGDHPSSFDRKSSAFKYMTAQGWDPDTRKGLGANCQGRPEPVQLRKRADRAGLGVDGELVESVRGQEESNKDRMARIIKNSMSRDDRLLIERTRYERNEKMRDLLYGDEEVHKYLGQEV